MRVVRTVLVALAAAGSPSELAQVGRCAVAGMTAMAIVAAVLLASAVAVALGLL